MAAYMDNWLGPLIDKELKFAVQWKRCPSTTAPPAFSGDVHCQAPLIEPNAVLPKLADQRKFKRMYKDDGSSLRATISSSPTSKRVVQVIEVCSTLHSTHPCRAC
jgi:hypothetical protein